MNSKNQYNTVICMDRELNFEETVGRTCLRDLCFTNSLVQNTKYVANTYLTTLNHQKTNGNVPRLR